MPKRKVTEEEEINNLSEVYARNSGITIDRDSERHAFVTDLALAVKPRVSPGSVQQKKFPLESEPFDYLV